MTRVRDLACSGAAEVEIVPSRRTARRTDAIIRETLADTPAIVHGRKADTPVILVQNVAREDEKRVDCRLDQMADTIAREGLTGPVIMLIGANSRTPVSHIAKRLKEVA